MCRCRGSMALRCCKKAAGAESAEHCPQIVFATAFDQYAVRAFDVNAVDYLLKPFDRARVLQALTSTAASAGSQQAKDRRLPAPRSTTDARLDALLRLVETARSRCAKPQTGK